MTTVLVCGGRDYAARDYVFKMLDDRHAHLKFTLLIHGGAKGADRLAGEWAEARRVPVRAFPADWSLHGRAAGVIRNTQMLLVGQPDYVIAFPGGKGTADMVRQATKAGVPVMVYTEPARPMRRTPLPGSDD